jgi:hypothetical protein
MEDWRQCTDILRVNENFHGAPRFDAVLVNTSNSNLRHSRLELVFHLELPRKDPSNMKADILDLALLRTFKPGKWRPRTYFDGCRVVDEGDAQIISLDYIERGCMLVNTNLLTPGSHSYYVDDAIDADMLLRLEKYYGNSVI